MSLFAALILPGLLPPSGSAQPPWVRSRTSSFFSQNLRIAEATVHTQAAATKSAADAWRHRAKSADYTDAQFKQDFKNVEWQFHELGNQFNLFRELTLHLRRPAADNLVAELDAGLNIIAELFVFLDKEFATGTLDHITVSRTAHVIQDAIREWDHELRRNSSRLR